MTTIIAIVLILIAVYCGANWLLIFYWWLRGRLYDELDAAERAFQFGLCFILALGFAGLLLK